MMAVENLIKILQGDFPAQENILNPKVLND